MEERNIFERLADISPGMEIWWDSSPVVYGDWSRRVLGRADPADRGALRAQLGRMFDRDSPGGQLFRGVTTNPPLSLQAVRCDPVRWAGAAREIMSRHPGLDREGLFWELYKAVVRAGSEMLLPLYEASGGREGFLSGQVDPRSVFDRGAMIRQAEEIAAVNPNVMVKVPGSSEGYEVIEHLTARGISTNNTLSFVLPQLADCADSVARGVETARRNGVDLSRWRSVITHMAGRFGNLGGLRELARERGVELTEGDIRLAELAVFKKAHRYLADHGRPSKMLVCSLLAGPEVGGESRIWHLEEIAGADVVVTCPPAFIEKVLFMPGVERITFTEGRIHEDIPRGLMDRLMRVPYFERGYAEDGYSRDEYNTLPALQQTAAQFAKATDEMVDFAAECLEGDAGVA